jgi:hypothetical protein
MTFAETLAAAIKLLGPDDSVCVGVDAWSYPGGDTRLTWDVWSDSRRMHWYGSTPEAALAAVQSTLDELAHDAHLRIEAVQM